jgi:hypothetical protein
VLVALPIVFIVMAMFSVLGLAGVRRYLGNAKASEARNSVAFIGKSAVAAYEENKKICPSASSPVPAAIPHGRKYQSEPGEWSRDKDRNAGFACLKFEMNVPQYYQYDYQATDTGFTAIARGDLNGDGTPSSFTITGKLVGDALIVSPTIEETNPGE